MKYFSLFILLCFSSISLSAQRAQVRRLATHQINSYYQLDLEKDQLQADSSHVFPVDENKLLNVKSKLVNNEIIIQYNIEPIDQKDYYVLQLEIAINDEIISIRPGYLIGATKLDENSTPVQELIWTNIMADLPDTQGKLRVTLKLEWWGSEYYTHGIDCSKYPVFGLRQKLPYYQGLVLAGGSMITGFIFWNKAQQHLDLHKSSNILSERTTSYDSYTGDLKKAEIFSYLGVGIIVLDAILYSIRREKHKNRVKKFDKYCTEASLSVRPIWEFPTPDSPSNLGLRFSYQF